MRILKRTRYPPRRSKYSNNSYSDHQHVAMLVLRQHFAVSYRDFCEVLEVCTLLVNEIGLRRVPHFTTLQKFSSRTETRRLERSLPTLLPGGPLQRGGGQEPDHAGGK